MAKPSSSVTSEARVDLNTTPLMNSSLTSEVHFTAIRTFGEVSSIHNSDTMQLAPLDESHALQMRVDNVPDVTKAGAHEFSYH